MRTCYECRHTFESRDELYTHFKFKCLDVKIKCHNCEEWLSRADFMSKQHRCFFVDAHVADAIKKLELLNQNASDSEKNYNELQSHFYVKTLQNQKLQANMIELKNKLKQVQNEEESHKEKLSELKEKYSYLQTQHEMKNQEILKFEA